jgi:hypothetical protein
LFITLSGRVGGNKRFYNKGSKKEGKVFFGYKKIHLEVLMALKLSYETSHNSSTAKGRSVNSEKFHVTFCVLMHIYMFSMK